MLIPLMTLSFICATLTNSKVLLGALSLLDGTAVSEKTTYQAGHVPLDQRARHAQTLTNRYKRCVVTILKCQMEFRRDITAQSFETDMKTKSLFNSLHDFPLSGSGPCHHWDDAGLQPNSGRVWLTGELFLFLLFSLHRRGCSRTEAAGAAATVQVFVCVSPQFISSSQSVDLDG